MTDRQEEMIYYEGYRRGYADGRKSAIEEFDAVLHEKMAELKTELEFIVRTSGARIAKVVREAMEEKGADDDTD